MSMTAQVFSISALSVELGRDRRTIGKALARVPPDGETADGRQGWFLTTAQRALESSEDRRHRGQPLMIPICCGPSRPPALLTHFLIACQRAAESPHFGARNFPHLAGTAINRLSDQQLRVSAVDRDA